MAHVPSLPHLTIASFEQQFEDLLVLVVDSQL